LESYLSSTVTANNGSININTKEDANVIGSSIIAQDVIITTNNLNVESLQSKLISNSESNSYSFGGNIGFNNSDSSQDRLWTDNVASIIGTNSVTINTENNTDIKGALVANITNYTSSSSLALGRGSHELVDGNNLTINTKTLTYSNLQDQNNSETNAIGINVGLPVGFGGASPSGLSLVADAKNTTLGLSYAANSSNQSGETKATIGNGTINLNSTITRDATTGEVTNITGQETLANDDSRISNLNRDIQTNQVTGPTHYEGGYNIDLNISFAVLNRAYELRKDGLLADEAKKNLTGTAKLYGDAAVKTYEVVSTTAQEIYREVGVIFTPEQQAQVNQAIASGNTQKVYDLIEARGISLSDETKEKIRQKVEGEVGGNKFLASLTDEERQALVQPKTIGIFFDGTNNNAERDLARGEESNVWRLRTVYNGEKIYIPGVGSYDEFGDTFCQATGCGASLREREGMNKFAQAYYKMVSGDNNQPFVIADSIGFSRGAATSRDFANMLLNDGVTSSYGSIMSELIILRSVTPFDTVSSFGAPWNGVDIGKNFATNLDTIVVHPTAEDEVRTNFALQSIKAYEGAVLPSNWIEQSFPGVHSDIGGSFADGFQGKSNDISKYVLNSVVNDVNRLTGEKVFNTPPAQWQPSTYLNVVMDTYLQAKANNDQATAQAAKSILQDKYIHDSVKQYNPAHWSFGDRETHYPNKALTPLFSDINQN
jgi:hypothetical protein